MKLVSEKDYFEVISSERYNDVSNDIIFDLYQPLIGYKAASVYFSLIALISESNEALPHSYLFNKMQISPGDFYIARKTLEGVGLLNTYLKRNSNPNQYCYIVFKPLSAREFFNDILFKGMLIKQLGKKKVDELVFKYISPTLDNKEYEDITLTFKEVFNIDLNDNAFLVNLGVNKTTTGLIRIEIDVEELNKILLNEYHIIKDNLPTDKDIEEIKRISALFNLNEIRLASLLFESYDARNKDHYDFKKMLKLATNEERFGISNKISNKQSEVYSDSDLSKKINMMENTSPSEFLRIRQGNVTPAPADLNIVYDLSKKYNLNIGVINVLIDYVLVMNNNAFPRSYTEKVAAALVRNHIETALDAMNYFSNNKRKLNKNKKEEKPEVVEQTKEESFDDLLKELNNIK